MADSKGDDPPTYDNVMKEKPENQAAAQSGEVNQNMSPNPYPPYPTGESGPPGMQNQYGFQPSLYGVPDRTVAMETHGQTGYTGIMPAQAEYMGTTLGEAGYTRTTREQAGYTGTTFGQAGYTGTTLGQTGYTGTMLGQAGYTGTTLGQVGYSGTTFGQVGQTGTAGVSIIGGINSNIQPFMVGRTGNRMNAGPFANVKVRVATVVVFAVLITIVMLVAFDWV